MKSPYGALLAIASVVCLSIALLSAVAAFHTNTTAWFIGGVLAFVLSVLTASYSLYKPTP
jgi:hypothetical protein